MSEQQPIFGIEKIFLKDLSLEIPNAPQIFAEQEAPKIDINLHNETREIDAGIYEVVLTATVTAKVKEDKTAFLVEVAQAGIFQIRNVAPQDLDALLGISCGNILFPYLREAVSSVVTRGGFPPFFLNHLNFEALYQQRLQQQQQQAAAGASQA
ncbi:MAG TPA: protein-export chaperone SecB [Burkholderiales bacterium]|nr:protein-export chaperone SecB [Burkholderiales bacterium]